MNLGLAEGNYIMDERVASYSRPTALQPTLTEPCASVCRAIFGSIKERFGPSDNLGANPYLFASRCILLGLEYSPMLRSFSLSFYYRRYNSQICVFFRFSILLYPDQDPDFDLQDLLRLLSVAHSPVSTCSLLMPQFTGPVLSMVTAPALRLMFKTTFIVAPVSAPLQPPS